MVSKGKPKRYKVVDFYRAGFAVFDNLKKDYVRGSSKTYLIRTTTASAQRLADSLEEKL